MDVLESKMSEGGGTGGTDRVPGEERARGWWVSGWMLKVHNLMGTQSLSVPENLTVCMVMVKIA